MLFITKRKHNRILQEERESRQKLAETAYDAGYRACLADNGGKGFIAGAGYVTSSWFNSGQFTDDLFQEIKDYLNRRV